MNQRPLVIDGLRPHRATGTDSWHAATLLSVGRRSAVAALLRSAVLVLGCALSAFAQAPPTSGIERMVAIDAATKLNSSDPEVRGEAALIVASAGQLIHEARLLELAQDPDPRARLRAIIALGLLATPSAVTFLELKLQTVDGRSGDDGIAAAYALGSVPPARVGTSVARTLTQFAHGSWKRQHDSLVALLLGMSRHPERSERRALQDLLQNEANRAPDARALVLQLLLPLDQGFDATTMRRILRRGSAQERLAIVTWLADRSPDANQDWIDDLVGIAQRGEQPELRSAALLALTRCRHMPALEIAARALKSSSPEECTQAMTAMLSIGGASTHGALEQHLLVERNPARAAAMMQGFQAPPSQRLIAHVITVATDTSQPFATRAAAAEMVSRSDKKRAAPLLRDLFHIATRQEELTSIARALRRVEDSPTALSRLLDRPNILTHHADRWQALLAAGHGEAQRQVLAVLEDDKGSDTDVLAAVKSWRRAMVLRAPAPQTPKRLREILE